MILRILLASLLVFAAAAARAQQAAETDAPFGLTWGMSVEQIKDRGVKLAKAPYEDYGKSFGAKKLPKSISDSETVILSFGNNDKLWRIVALSRNYTGDPTGAAVKARYRTLVGALNEKYGAGKSIHRIDRTYWRAPNEFVIGIKTGKSRWLTDYDTPVMTIDIAIIALNSDAANWRLIFENKALRAAFDGSSSGKDKKAL